MRRPWKALTALGISVFLLALVSYRWQERSREPDGTALRAEFVSCVRGQRPAEGRLSWDFTYAAYTPAAAARGTTSQGERGKIELAIAKAASRQRSATTLGGLAIVDLFRGQTGRAVQTLREATDLAPGDATLLSDLAAALLEHGSRHDRPSDLFQALEMAERAVAADPDFPQANFNRALALERLFLADPSRQAWEGYLELDPHSDWAREARRQLATLAADTTVQEWDEQRERLAAAARDDDLATVSAIAASHPREVRQYVEETLLGTWADEMSAGLDDQARQSLARARAIGDALASRAGDDLAVGAVQAIERADPTRLASLVDGHRAYRDARRLYRQQRVSEADTRFLRARRALRRGRSPTSLWASLYLAIGQFGREELEGALSSLRQLLELPETERYPSFQGRVHWMIGLATFNRGEPAATLAAYGKALEIFERTQDRAAVASLHQLLAEILRYLGEDREAWRHLYQALALTPHLDDLRRLYVILSEASYACSDAGLHRAARRFRGELIRVAHLWNDPAAIAHALLQQAAILGDTGDVQQATASLAEARGLLRRIPDEAIRLRVAADLAMTEGEVEAEIDPVDAAAKLGQALDYFLSQGHRRPLVNVYEARGRAALAAGEPETALAEYQHGIEEYELLRERVPQERLRISSFEKAQRLFDAALRLQALRGYDERAFEYAERKRARALLDRLGDFFSREQRQQVLEGEVPAMDAAEIEEAIPDGVVLVEYALLEDRLLTWVLCGSGLEMISTPIRVDTVEAQIDELLRQIEQHRRRAGLEPSATALFDLLLRPVSSRLGANDIVFLVPDRALHKVPFAALLDSNTGRYFVEDHAVAVVPSSTLYVHALRRARPLSSGESAKILVVGDPKTSPASASGLEDLHQADEEAAAVAALYPGSFRLRPAEATPANFLAAMGKYEIVHFAGHAVVNDEYPLLSYLLMAPEDHSDPGLLYAHEINAARLEATRLVILSACSTARGPTNGQGVFSLARVFLAAGAPAVIAALWDVDDRASARLLRRFHESLIRGDDAVSALRAAQLEFIHDPDEDLQAPRAWAPFLVIGGVAPHQASEGGQQNG